jgi:orotate phosphoribosyltransferase
MEPYRHYLATALDSPVSNPNSTSGHLFQTGKFRLHSGDISNFKIDADALTQSDLESLANQVHLRCCPFGRVEGVPRGGLRFAKALCPYATGKGSDPLLIVDDVYTVGTSMETHRADRSAIGVVIFARKEPHQKWIKALFTMAPYVWPWFPHSKGPIDG